MSQLRVQPMINEKIKATQSLDSQLMKINEKVLKGQKIYFGIQHDSFLWYGKRLYIPNDPDLKWEIMEEVHNAVYLVHPRSNKIYKDLKEWYSWNNIEREITEFVSKCLTYKRVKVEHQKLSGLLQPLEILEWKWEHITMDFVSGLPKTNKWYDSIWDIVDKFTKSAYFLPVRVNYSLDKLAKLYIDEIVKLHEIQVSVMLDKDSRFIFRFWKSL